MHPKVSTSDGSAVDLFIKKSKHLLKLELQQVRDLLLASDSKVTEHIKWNAPSFCYEGDDRITFNLSDKKILKLIFHRGAKVKDAKNFSFADPSKLIEWLAKDRGVIKIVSRDHLKEIEKNLLRVAKRWFRETRD